MYRAHTMADSNSIPGESVVYPRPPSSFPDMVINLVKKAVLLVVRFYVLAALWIYHWLKKIFTRALQPLEPVFQQVKKVPKKDISAEGIFYQTLRLQFLLFLYITPFILSAFHYLAQPLVWLRDWLFAFVEEDEKYSKKSTEE
ncbi:hypothetical protein BgiBS90_003442 [Biomphalaria glabrata]|nr:hypothetical protein BgiBS90_003442 [Biomphalaria glabrata]